MTPPPPCGTAHPDPCDACRRLADDAIADAAREVGA